VTSYPAFGDISLGLQQFAVVHNVQLNGHSYRSAHRPKPQLPPTEKAIFSGAPTWKSIVAKLGNLTIIKLLSGFCDYKPRTLPMLLVALGLEHP
jgi:hypothetical protein